MLKTQCFRAKKISGEQRCFTADSHWNNTVHSLIFHFWIALIQRKLELISSETALNNVKFLFRADYLWNFNQRLSELNASGSQKILKMNKSQEILKMNKL